MATVNYICTVRAKSELFSDRIESEEKVTSAYRQRIISGELKDQSQGSCQSGSHYSLYNNKGSLRTNNKTFAHVRSCKHTHY